MKEQTDKLKDIILQIEKIKMWNNFEEAYKLIEESIIKYSDDYRLYEEMADVSIYLWNIKKAQKSIDYALNINPDSATGNYLKWFILLTEDHFTEALDYLEKSNKLLWNNSEVLRNLGWAYTMNNQVEKGITILKRALNLSPWDKLITEDLAMALIWKGEIDLWNKLLEEIQK
jgi:tetratricopeptide (TPR) repeat protein